MRIWTNLKLNEQQQARLIAGVGPQEIQFDPPEANLLTQGGTGLDGFEIAFGQPAPAAVINSEPLKWVHLSSAGYTAFDTAAIREAVGRRDAQVTNSSEVYAEPCSEHLLAFLLAETRQLMPAHVWQLTTREWRQDEIRSRSRLLTDASILILGLGAIGQRLGQLLSPFGCRVYGYKRHPAPLPNLTVIGPEELDNVLGATGHLVNVLPENDSTRGFFDEQRFNRLVPGAVYYSIGRGRTTDQSALRRALLGGQLSAAYLDVTDPEPLPPEDPLWGTPNCFITPHSSGGHVTETDRHVTLFLKNFRRYSDRQELIGRVI